MIFKRYSSPFLFLDNLIENNLLCSGIDTIYKQNNEDKLWARYLSDPIKEMSYNDWKNEITGQQEEHFEVAKDIEKVKEHSINILKNFKP